ncbi:MAG TPA: alpha/beta hydrolase, partial [Thermoanaerobaculia bacterium]|nr:alpha/beta hydrolase [Thermoanaerobaculia bacterium]
ARYHEKIRPQHLPSLLYGFSLGGAIAAQVIKRHPFDGLILQSTFTSLPHITRVLFPRLPMHLLAGNLFNTLEVVRQLQVPLLVLHGTADEVIPCRMAHQLFDSCTAKKRIFCVEGGLHKDLYVKDADTLIWAISQFIADLPRRGHALSVEETPLLEQMTDVALRALHRVTRGNDPRHGVIASAPPA